MTVTFTDRSDPGVISWAWSFGNSNTSAVQNPSTIYSGPGVYPVTLTVTGPGGTSTKTKNVTVFDKPTVAFTTASTAGCAPFSTSFTSTVTLNGPGPGSYVWDFGDGATATGPTASHVYGNAGSYTVSLTVSNAAGCTRTVSRTNYITAHAKPIGSFSASQTVFCIKPAAVVFTNTSFGGLSPYTANWTFGDNTTGTGNTASKTYNADGYYTVSMIVKDANGCADTVTTPNYIGVIGQSATFTAPLKACVNEEITVTNMTTGAVSKTEWDFGDLTPVSAGNIATHVYSAPGTYTIAMSTVISGCTKPAQQTIIVHPNPAVTIAQSPAIPCPAPVNVTFTGLPTGTGYTVSSYSWVFVNSGGTASGQSTVHNYTKNDYDKVHLFAVSSEGCRDSIKVDTVAIRDLLMNIAPGSLCAAPVDTIAGCNPLRAEPTVELFSSLPVPKSPCAYDPYPAQAVSWKWNFGDGVGTSTSANPAYSYRVNGTYKATCLITTSNGCTDSAVRWVHVDSPVRPSFYASPLTTCPKELVTFFNTTAKHIPGTRYTFNIVNDSTISKLDTTPTYNRFRDFGTYDVRMLSNFRGCIDSFNRKAYIRVFPPRAEFTDSVYCFPNQGVKLINLSDSATSYEWFFGDGSTSSAVNPLHSYASTGDYEVILVAHNSRNNCTDTFRKIIHIFRPDITFRSPDTAVCKNAFVVLQGAFGGTGVINYSWKIDNLRTGWDTASKYTHQITTVGYHTVTLYAISGNNCLDSFKRNDYILSSGPNVMFDAAPHVGCQPLTVTITDNTTNVPIVPTISKILVFGNGDSSKANTQTFSYTYAGRGIFNPKLIITDSLGCKDSLTRNGYIEVYKPTALFTNDDDSVCTYEPVFFKSYSTGKAPLRFRWDFGDNISASTSKDTVSHFYPAPGIYHVRLIVTDSVGCSDTMHIQKDIRVDAPEAAFSMSDTLAICPPLLIQFTDRSTGADRYSWNFGTGGTAPVTTANPVWTFDKGGLFEISLVVTNVNGCTDTARSNVRVLGGSGEITYTPLLGCAPMLVSFSTPIVGIPNLTWDFGDGIVATTTNSGGTTHTYASPGSYLPKAIFSGPGCPGTPSTGRDTIRVDRLTADFNWSVPCEGVAFTLTDASRGLFSVADSFRWEFNGGAAISSGRSTQYTYSSSGAKSVKLTVRNAAGCSADITKSVFINPSPDLNALADTAICPDDTATLRASNAVTYTWSPAPQNPSAGLSCTNCQFPRVYPGAPAVYLVTGVDANGCIGHDSTRIRIQIKTTASTGAGGEICLGESFRLNASGGHRYEWLPSATVDSPFIASPLATPRTTTTYIVAAQAGTCLVDSQRVTVVVRPAPNFSAGPDKILSLGSATTLEAKGDFRSISWHNNDTTLSCHDCRNPNAHPYYTRTYAATATNEWGCATTDSVTVFVRCNGSLVFIPNTFTPNGDGKNDWFYPQGAGFDRFISFYVFNRWGQPVFEQHNALLNDERSGWDGTFKGQALIPDTYIYTMQGRCPTGEIIDFKGDVTLIR